MAIAKDHFVVAIGASAGGLEAIHEFFDHMSDSANLSFVIIQHLSSDYKSLLVELVSRHTRMKVFEAENDTAIEKNCIYVIPNNKLITIQKNKLCLEEKKNNQAPNNASEWRVLFGLIHYNLSFYKKKIGFYYFFHRINSVIRGQERNSSSRRYKPFY